MKTQTTPWPLPACIEAITFDGITYCIEHPADYAAAELPPTLRAYFQTRVIVSADPDAEARASYEAEQQAAKEAEFARYKARAGQPSYKAVVVKIAAEKLGVLDIINTTIVALISTAQDKSLLVWWDEIDTISRADAQWQEIETALPKNIDVTELFTLVTQITISALPSSPPTTINLLFSEQPQTTINPAAPTMWQKTKQFFGF